MKKGPKITLIVVAVIVLAIISAYLVIGSDSIVPAHLTVDSGKVQVDTGKGWVDTNSETDLEENDKVKTIDGEATLVLYDSVIVTLEPNTEIAISDLSQKYPKISQESGSTWTKFANVVGITSFDVQTPSTVATVRGTEFGVDTEGNDSTVSVGEGNVDVESDGKVSSVKQFQKLVKVQGADAVLSSLTPEEKAKLARKVERSLNKMKRLRFNAIMRQKHLLNIAKRVKDFNEQDIRDNLDKIDRGELNDQELIAKSPLKPRILYRIQKMDDKIKEEQRLLDLLRQ